MSNRLLARTLVIGVLGCGMGLGCDSPSRPTPLGTPTAPRPPALAVRSVTPAFGPPGVATDIRVTGEGFQPGATLTLDGIPATIAVLTSTFISATTPPLGSRTVDVAVTNPDGQNRSLLAGYTFGIFSLAASPSHVTPREVMTVSWEAPAGRGHLGGGDWISLFKVGDPDVNHGWFTHVNGASSGTVSVPAPAFPGQYEFRYMVGDSAVARSNTVTVSAAASQ